MKLIQVLDAVRPSVRAMTGYTPGEQAIGRKAIKLNTNESPYPPSQKVIQAITQAAATGLERYPDSLASSFRIVAAEVLGVEPKNILCGNGSDDLLTILTRAFVGEQGTLWFPTPSYILYRTLSEIQGARVVEIPFDKDWSIDPDQIDSNETRPSLMFLPNPNSPSGTMMTRDAIRRLAESLPCPLVVDEAYVDFADDDCIELTKSHANVIVTRTLSKSYGLAGIRFGFLIANEAIVSELGKIKDSYNCDALAIAGATAAFGDQSWLRGNVERIRATRATMQDSLEEIGFDVVPSSANFLWCKHPDFSARQLHEYLKSNNVLVRYMNYEGTGDGLRISVGTDAQVSALLSLLRRFST